MHKEIIIPDGHCQCGCGKITKVAPKTDAANGDVAGRHRRFIRGHQYGPPKRSEYIRAQDRRLHDKRRERRRAWYADFMNGRVCERCGSPDAPFNWHHKDPATKSFPIGRRVLNATMNLLLAEIAKCELLCKDCHNEAHRNVGNLIS